MSKIIEARLEIPILIRISYWHSLLVFQIDGNFNFLSKGQEISKAIFLENPLPKKRPKFLKDSCPSPKMGQIKKMKALYYKAKL